MKKKMSEKEFLHEYMSKFKINDFFDDKGENIQSVLRSIILKKCNPIKTKQN